MKIKLSKNAFRFIVYLAISGVLLFINEAFIKGNNDVVYTVFLTIGVTLWVNAGVSFVDGKCFGDEVELATKANMEVAKEGLDRIESAVINQFSVLKNYTENGFYGVFDTFPLKTDEAIKKSFLESKSVYICMYVGSAFVFENDALVKERVKKKDLATTFIVQDFNQKDILSALAKRVGKSGPEYYERRIKSFVTGKLQKSLWVQKGRKHILNVKFNPTLNTLGVVLTDDYAMYSIYRGSKVDKPTPHYVFLKGSEEFKAVKADISSICKSSIDFDMQLSVDAYTGDEGGCDE